MLEIVRETLFDEWLPDLRLEPVISVKTWQPIAPRCSVCSVGYVRFRSTIESFQQHPLAYINLYGSQNISSSSENTHHTHLCLACAVRKELFLQSQKFFPESALRADQRVAWPFMHRKNVKESTMPPPTFSFLSAPHAPSSMDPAVMAATAGHHNNDLGVHVGEDAFNENPPEGERLVIPHTLDAGGSADSISAMSWTTGLTSGLALSDHLHQLQLHQQYQQYGQQQQQALVLLPPTSLQTAQSNSPVKSQRLQDLDTRYDEFF